MEDVESLLPLLMCSFPLGALGERERERERETERDRVGLRPKAIS